jgi:hypothetical protein
VASALLADYPDINPERDKDTETMATKVMGFAKKAAGLLMIELLVPGGTLIILGLLLTGGTLPVPEKIASVLPILKLIKRV